MRLENPIPSGRAPHEGDGGVDEEHAAQYQPIPRGGRVGAGRSDNQHAEYIAQKTAADVSHENPGGGSVPEQKAAACRTEHDTGRRHGNPRREQRATPRYENGLRCREAVDPIHEIEEIQRPDDQEYAEHVTQPAESHELASHAKRGQPAETPQSPCRGAKMDREPDACAHRTMVIEEADYRDRKSTQQSSQQPGIQNTEPCQYTECSRSGNYYRSSAATRSRKAVRAALIRYIQHTTSQRTAPHSGCQQCRAHSNHHGHGG